MKQMVMQHGDMKEYTHKKSRNIFEFLALWRKDQVQ